jgi:hypothetical protein
VRFWKAAIAAVAAAVLVGAAPPQPSAHSYAEGQVWEYHTRPGEEGSLLKIQKIETLPELAADGPVYHISLIGLHLGPGLGGMLQHAPVSRETLDASVTRLSTAHADFPDVGPEITEWRQAKGGVFTISVAQIVESLDQMTRNAPQTPPARSPNQT